MSGSLPRRVRVVEVGPRDGLQNEPGRVPTDVKVALVNRLLHAGFAKVEAGSFVSPKWVPQMADTAEVLARVPSTERDKLVVLTPNLEGFEAAQAAQVPEIAVFAAASESFSRRNINCSIAESLRRFEPICAAAGVAGMRVRGYVSCVLGCPYEGTIASQAVVDVARVLLELGCYEISLGDTIGVGSAGDMHRLLDACEGRIPVERLALHCHDTYGQALANILAGLERGVAVVDASVAGLGGCPYAKGATGNVATEAVVYLLHGLGIETGIDFARLAAAGDFISAALGRARKPAWSSLESR